jgi:hypothetical protein
LDLKLGKVVMKYGWGVGRLGDVDGILEYKVVRYVLVDGGLVKAGGRK